MVALNHRVLASLEVGGGDLHADLDVLIDEAGLKAVDSNARLGEGVARLILTETSLADFHAGRLGDTQSIVCRLDGAIQLREVGEDRGAGAIAMVAGGVAAHANAAGAGREHG